MLEARGITKRYPGVVALAGVDFSVSPGEIVALIGENGAGKSTLIKILGGLVTPDAGEIFLQDSESGNRDLFGGDERDSPKPVTASLNESRVTNPESRVTLRSASDATALGIGLIHQELNNLDNLDIAGNVFLGREPRKMGILLDRKKMEEEASAYLQRLGLNLDPRTSLSKLSIAQQQMVEIAKALSQNAKYLIMDEPTSSLTAGETERLMEIAEELREQGVGVVYVSHRLNEVKRLADRVVVFRDGKNAGELRNSGFEIRDSFRPVTTLPNESRVPSPESLFTKITTENMVRLMVGRDLIPASIRDEVAGAAVLEVKDLRTIRFPSKPVSFVVRAGEIVGVAGLVGAGRTEVARALFGADPRTGTVLVKGEELPPHRIDRAIKAGLLLAPEDRRHEGLITSMTIRENITMPQVPAVASVGLISRSRERALADEMKDRLRVKAPTVESLASGLSGGNQQKVVLAKWLAMKPKVMIFDEPTRGIDIGARAEIYELMAVLAHEGVGILMISSDMEEVLAMSDRVLVMHEGSLAGELPRKEANEEAVMRLAVGNV